MKQIVLLLTLSTLAFAADTPKPENKPEPTGYAIPTADSLAIREAQVAYLRAKSDTTQAQANEQAALQRLVALAADAIKHAGADPEKFQLNEEGGKFVIKAIPLPEAPKKEEKK